MTEAIIQADLQRELLRLTGTFSAGDVTINDWSVKDGSSQAAPFAIIEAADDFALTGMETQFSDIWQIPFTLLVAFSNWDTSLVAFQAVREIVIAALRNTTHYDSQSSTLAWGLRAIKSGSAVVGFDDKYPDNPAESLPVYLMQLIILQVEENL